MPKRDNPTELGTRTNKGKAHGLAISALRMSRFLQAVAGGNYISTACKYAGITPPTYRNWVALGEREVERVRTELGDTTETDPEDLVLTWLDEHSTQGSRGNYAQDAPALRDQGPEQFSLLYWPCVVFAFLLEKAEAEAEVSALSHIQLAARKSNHWQAAMTFLERRHPERWARRDRMSIEGGPAGSQPINVAVSTDSLLERIQELGAAEAAKRAAREAADAG